jgi:hypothetical protein
MGATTLSLVTFNIFSIKGLFVILSISDTQHKRHSALQCFAIMPSVPFYLFIIMLNVIMLKVVMLNVIMLKVVMPSVIAPIQCCQMSLDLKMEELVLDTNAGKQLSQVATDV